MTLEIKLITSWLVCCRVVHGHSMLKQGIWGLMLQDNCWFFICFGSEPGKRMEGKTCWDRYGLFMESVLDWLKLQEQ